MPPANSPCSTHPSGCKALGGWLYLHAALYIQRPAQHMAQHMAQQGPPHHSMLQHNPSQLKLLLERRTWCVTATCTACVDRMSQRTCNAAAPCCEGRQVVSRALVFCSAGQCCLTCAHVVPAVGLAAPLHSRDRRSSTRQAEGGTVLCSLPSKQRHALQDDMALKTQPGVFRQDSTSHCQGFQGSQGRPWVG